MKRVEMVRTGAEQLIDAEQAIETALVKVLALGSNLGQMGLSANLALTYGQGTMTALVKTIGNLSEARSAMIEAHEELAEVKVKLGCSTVMVGNTDKPPVTTGAASADLRVVSERAA